MQVPKAKILSLSNEAAARRLGWTPDSQITWREFLEQYPYFTREAAKSAARPMDEAA